MYKLKETPNKGKFIINVTGDVNDGDYIKRTTILTKEQFEEFGIIEVLYLLKFCSGPHEFNGANTEWISLPYGSCDDFCHTLTEVKIEYIDKKGSFYLVKLDDFDEQSKEIQERVLAFNDDCEEEYEDEEY